MTPNNQTPKENSTHYKCGYVALIGRPNVGKSTLLNKLIGERIAAVSPKAQTTRRRFRGIRSDEDSQIIFVDTPGIHKAKEGAHLNEFCVSEALDVLKDADVYVYIVDGTRPYKPNTQDTDEQFLLQALKKTLERNPKPLFVLLNKMDMFGKSNKFIDQEEFKATLATLPYKELFPISAKSGTNLDKFLEAVKKEIPEGPALYPTDELTDQNMRTIAAELIQEKLFYLLGEEIPYSCAVEVEKFAEPSPTQRLPEISAAIHVEKESQKPMLIGKGGAKIKEIGIAAREAIEQMMGTKVVLKLFVKVTPKWTQNKQKLKELGYALPEDRA